MKKLCFFLTAIWVCGLILLPLNVMAKMTAMTDNQLRMVTGQAGINIRASDVINNFTADSLSYTDTDGFGDEYSEPGTISLTNVSYQGGIINSDIDIDTFTEKNDNGDTINVIDLSIRELDMYVDHYSTEIMLGDKSLGVFGIHGLRTHISGNVRIYMRQ